MLSSNNKPVLKRKAILAVLGMYVFFALSYAMILFINGGFKDTIYFKTASLDFITKGLLTLPVWYFVFRVYQTDIRWKRYLWHLLFAPLWVFSFIKVYYFFCEGLDYYHLEGNAVVWDVYYPFMFYVIQFGCFHLYDEILRSAQQAQRGIELREMALRSELTALKAQLNPHFLYNVFNTINASLPPKEEYTRELIAKLADLFRYQLVASKKSFVPLENEIHFIQTYLELEEARYKERLSVKWEVDQSLLGVHVPPMLLQPIVENAIRHGIAPKIEGGTVCIRIQRKEDRIQVNILDDGIGFPNSTEDHTDGFGLGNTRKILSRLYGETLIVADIPSGGTRICFTLPVQHQPLAEFASI